MKVESYLNFDGRCEEAIKFYQSALGAEVVLLMRFKDVPEPDRQAMVTPGVEDKVMHATLRIGETIVMASDGRCLCKTGFQGFSLAIALSDESVADRLFAALADGGEVQMPLSKTFWSPRFGMVTDRFGVAWMINVTP